jgi:hypothetical protein
MSQHTGSSGLDRRDFLRSAAFLGTTLGAGALAVACAEDGQPLSSSSEELVPGRKWVRIDSVDVQTGIFTSLDGYSDTSQNMFASDVDLAGHAVLPSGEIIPATVTVDQAAANALSLRSLGEGRYQIEVDGVAQPPGAPWEIHLVERTIPGTSVLSLTGYSDDPATGKRLVFTITHDPYIIVIVLGIAILMWVTAKPAYGTGCSGQGGAKSIKAKVGKSSGGGGNNSVGSRSISGGSAITAECTTECNHDQGGGG